MKYFSFLNLSGLLIKERNKKLLGFLKTKAFLVGDVLSVIFFSKNCPFSFEGMCLGIRRKSLLSPNTSFIMQGHAVGVYMRVVFSYYYNRLYSMVFLNYKRDLDFFIRSSKVFFKIR